jgi:hypothetical protein
MITPDLSKIPVVFEGSNFIILDVSNLLPKHPNYPHCSTVINPNTNKPYVQQGRGYYRLPGRSIEIAVWHQTLGGYHSAWEQLFNTAAFFVRDPAFKKNPKADSKNPSQPEWIWTGCGRGWPAFGYTHFISHVPLVLNDKWVVFQTNELDVICWHTGGGCNDIGIGIAFQGYFLAPNVTIPHKGTDGEPSEAQLLIGEAMWFEYCTKVLCIERLELHNEHGKLSCPGYTLTDKAMELRDLPRLYDVAY